jgi:hypothetical protein
MPFKAVVDTLDDIEDELHRAFYKEAKIKDAAGVLKTIFALDLEGVDSHPMVTALRNAHERQKKDTATAKARVAELEAKGVDVPEDFSAEEWERLKSVDESVKKNPDDPDKKRMHEAEVQSVKAMYEQKLAHAKTKAEADLKAEKEAHAKSKGTLRGRVVGDDLTKALIEANVDKKYLAATKALLEKSVKVIEDGDGTMTAVFETDLGEQPIDQFVPQWAQSDIGKHFLVPASGGGAGGSDGHKSSGNLTANPFSKAAWNMTKQAQLVKESHEKADRLAKMAGHSGYAGAKVENAK